MERGAHELSLSADELVRVLLQLEPRRRLGLLDSCGAGGAGRHLLIAGFDPVETVEVSGRKARIYSRESGERIVSGADALTLLDERLQSYAARGVGQKFGAGACLATFSYELAHQLEHLRTNRQRTPKEPDAAYAFYDALVLHDYASGRTYVTASDPRRLEELARELSGAPAGDFPIASFSSVARSNMTRAEYLSAILSIKEHIAAGDIYQANLTQRFTCRLGDGARPEDIFLRLRRDHPAPHAAFIRRRQDTVVSISPERFISVDDARRIEAWPIKGTRPRGASAPEDERLRRELLQSEKDRAENVMIVDLLRNDLGRVSRYGSVEVASLCEIAEHPTLFHLVSRVRAELRAGVTAGDILRASFPCGSITGAPKIRAMEIIDESEPEPRGLSMGAIGYFAFDGSLDLSVAIRTMVIRDGAARFNVGGGIVADSDPAAEYEESLVKARALFRALGVTT